MKPRPNPNDSNLDQFLNFAKQFAPKPAEPPSLEEMQRTLYASKVIDLFWFYGEPPKSKDETFMFYMNPDWPDAQRLPASIHGIMQILSVEELRFICVRLKKPEWVSGRNVLRGLVTLRDLAENW